MYFFYKIYSLCKNNAISKVLNKLQVFHFRSTVHTNTTTTVITHLCVLQKPLFCNDNGYKFEFNPIRSGLFQTVNDPGGGGFKSPPLRSRKLLVQSSPYHTCEFY